MLWLVWSFLILFGLGMPVCLTTLMWLCVEHQMSVKTILTAGMLYIILDIGKVVVKYPPWKI
jgi:predicted ABC-type sugar transport system permease subunit